MFYGKKVFRTLILILATIICALSMSTFNAYAEGGDGLYLGGFPAGFVLDTTKVEVVGICEVLTTKGNLFPCA